MSTASKTQQNQNYLFQECYLLQSTIFDTFTKFCLQQMTWAALLKFLCKKIINLIAESQFMLFPTYGVTATDIWVHNFLWIVKCS